VARAKKIDRAEARRRYRATLEESSVADGSTAAEVGSATAAAPAVRRPSALDMFRAAARPLDVRSDLAYLPDLILRTRAVWIPSLAVVASGVAVLALPGNSITSLLGQIFVAPPSLAGPFLAGLLAPRATYLAGGIVGFVASLVLIVAILLTPIGQVSQAGVDGTLDRGPIILYAIVVSPIFGLAVGAFAGYYRRFLYLSNTGSRRRAAARQGRPGAKVGPKRR